VRRRILVLGARLRPAPAGNLMSRREVRIVGLLWIILIVILVLALLGFLGRGRFSP
jgi:hypothetical protein